MAATGWSSPARGTSARTTSPARVPSTGTHESGDPCYGAPTYRDGVRTEEPTYLADALAADSEQFLTAERPTRTLPPPVPPLHRPAQAVEGPAPRAVHRPGRGLRRRDLPAGPPSPWQALPPKGHPVGGDDPDRERVVVYDEHGPYAWSAPGTGSTSTNPPGRSRRSCRGSSGSGVRHRPVRGRPRRGRERCRSPSLTAPPNSLYGNEPRQLHLMAHRKEWSVRGSMMRNVQPCPGAVSRRMRPP